MGTDIHGIFQAKKNGIWEDVCSEFKEDRHYFLFAWLADVRNGYGFAGIKTHTPLIPLSQPRGYPEDFQADGDHHKIAENAMRGKRSKWYAEEDADPSDESHLLLWMGDHSHSWLSGNEILSAPDQGVKNQGVISADAYAAWDGKTPESYSGDVWGLAIKVQDFTEQTWTGERPTPEEDTTHVRVGWFTGSVRAALSDFIEEVRRLQGVHGEIRYVFGFDS